MNASTETYFVYEGLPLQATFYPAATEFPKPLTLLYLHGGGLVFGDRDDLPDAYKKLLAEAGYALLTIDYPLAPEAQLPEIMLCLQQAVVWFNEDGKNLFHLGSADYVLFGRSAGAYLSFQLAARSADHHLKGLVSFYGYYSLDEPSFHQPNAYYNTFPKVPASYVEQLIQKQPLAVGPVTARFPLYLHARQTGKWIPLFLKDKTKRTAFNLTAEELQLLPPTFLTASTADKDVPYHFTQQAAQLIPEVVLHPVLGMPHDFDADLTKLAGRRTYQQLIHWLDGLSKKSS
ncbi:acetyl esterase/lipase [Trichococcus patagoniensis]|uniref:Acetyl esterase/lipase n=1 Tax=Trichococcus patagoniensis TaxID=382641 RepID=A0A2T5ICR0_9LACT|nr:alpha/beta hydrolase [Trichococcus patagoniensis]PTQ81610.1 acetyl esterase/lipase [Trichococcus patagoniensis]